MLFSSSAEGMLRVEMQIGNYRVPMRKGWCSGTVSREDFNPCWENYVDTNRGVLVARVLSEKETLWGLINYKLY